MLHCFLPTLKVLAQGGGCVVVWGWWGGSPACATWWAAPRGHVEATCERPGPCRERGRAAKPWDLVGHLAWWHARSGRFRTSHGSGRTPLIALVTMVPISWGFDQVKP